MKSLPREQAWLKWDEYWADATREFFKVETLQDYSEEEILQSPSYELWLQGEKDKSLKMIESHARKWAKQTREKPIRKVRIHIVKKPYSPYVEWEINHYLISNIPLGDEEVYLIDKDVVGRLKIEVPGDFMMFDDERVAHSEYSGGGKMLSMTFYEKGDDISVYLRCKELLLKHAKRVQPSDSL